MCTNPHCAEGNCWEHKMRLWLRQLPSAGTIPCCLAPGELCRVSESHWTGGVGEATVPAVPAVPTCAGPAARAQQELSCIASVAGCLVCKKYGASKDWLCCLAGERRINQVPFLLYLLAIHFYTRLCSRQQ